MGLLNAIGQGISQAGYAAGDIFAKQAAAEQNSVMELERQKRLLELRAQMDEKAVVAGENRKAEQADKARTDQVKRIEGAMGAVADEALAPKRGLINQGIADRSAWTPEQQAAVDQSLAADRAKVMGDPDTRTKAAIKTGDIDPKTAATMSSREDIQKLKTDAYLQNVQAKLDMAQDKLELAKTIAQLKAASGGADAKAPANAQMIEYLVKNGMSREDATTKVMGDNSGKTKDPVGLATQLASTILAKGGFGTEVKADMKKRGITEAQYAMEQATGLIEGATSRFRPEDKPAKPAPTPAPKPGAAPANRAAQFKVIRD